MMTRFVTALLFSSALFTSSCSAKPAKKLVTKNETVQSLSVDVDASREAQLATQSQSVTSVKAEYNVPDSAWRDLDPESTLYIDTDYGRLVVELYPEIAPGHVKQIKTLARQKFYDYITFHRVIEGFMNQTGDPTGTGTGDSDLPDLKAEFTFRRAPDMALALIGARPINPAKPDEGELGVGFYKALPVVSQPAAQAIMTKDGKVLAFGLHCKGVASMARAQDPNSANSQFFLMRGTSPHLDGQYTIWGNTVWGRDVLTQIKKGTKGETPNFIPDKMLKVQIAADVPEKDRLNIQVLDASSSAFKSYIKTLKNVDGAYPDVCDIEIPARKKP